MSGARVLVAGDGELGTPIAAQLDDAGFRVLRTPGGPVDVVVTATVEASREWVTGLEDVRAAHAAPLVGVIDELPTPQVTRMLVRRLEGVVLREALADALVPTLEAVLGGQAVHPLRFRTHLERPLLSTREKQVLAMVVLGFANVEIAKKLFVTEASIKAHLTSAFAKLGVHSREAATALILDPGAGYGPGILRITPQEDADAQR